MTAITADVHDSIPEPSDRVRPLTGALWAGRILSGLFVVLLSMDTAMKLLCLPDAVKATVQIGYPASMLLPLGVIELACLILYVAPRTALLGAIIWTGYLGGAVATHVRLGDPLWSHVLTPVYVATLSWLGLWLRDPRLRALTPLRSATR